MWKRNNTEKRIKKRTEKQKEEEKKLKLPCIPEKSTQQYIYNKRKSKEEQHIRRIQQKQLTTTPTKNITQNKNVEAI